MIHNKETARKIAELLLQIKAIILKPNDPFTWASGWRSPIYCDNRKTLSFPIIRDHIKKYLSKIIQELFHDTEIIGGIATGGIAHGALVAEQLDLPFIYIRSVAKNHGKQNKIEGVFKKGQKIILIEDLISSGKSSLEAVKSLRASGVNVLCVISIFTYGFKIAENNFNDERCKFLSLCDYDNMLIKALEKDYIQKSDLSMLEEWRKDPVNWKK